ncbi:MAG: hypothetical protein AAF726_21995 [Planctomycetota bacterium]
MTLSPDRSSSPASRDAASAGLVAFGAGIDVGGTRSNQATVSAPRPSRCAELSAPRSPAAKNVIAGRRVPSASGHTFADGTGTPWPRSGGPDLEAALDALRTVPVAGTAPTTHALAERVAEALSDDAALRDQLADELGPASSIDRFAPSARAIAESVDTFARGRRFDDVPEGEVVVVGLHWSESFARSGARAIRALSRGASALLLSDPRCPQLALGLYEGLAAAGVGERVAVLHDDGLDVLRAVAERPSIAVDAVRPYASIDGLRGRLTALREAAEHDPATLPDDEWFGHGVVARPAAPLRIRIPTGRDVTGGDVAERLGDEAVRLDASDPRAAAQVAVERAFGRDALGGFADDAAARLHVERHAFSRFSESLLQALEEADEDPWFDPPRWALSRGDTPGSPPLARGRRIGLDEGATLVHERRAVDADDAGRRRVQPDVRGLVFTNVEQRMRLGGALRVPGIVALLRCVGTSSSESSR